MISIVIYILIAILALFTPLCAQDDGWRTLKASYFTLHAADMGLTFAGIDAGMNEGNPLAAWHMENRGRGYAVSFGLMAALNWSVDKIREKNKTVGWIVLGVLTVFRGWVVWHNMRHLS